MADARQQVGFPEIVFGLPGTSKRMRNGPRQYVVYREAVNAADMTNNSFQTAVHVDILRICRLGLVGMAVKRSTCLIEP